MNIVLFTNTFTPHVGGVARSVEAFAAEYRRRGHRVLVVAPEFPNTPEDEEDVFRIPAIQNFNASDFSWALPIPSGLHDALEDFQPDIVHSQHPFLLGNTAVRIARSHGLPLVFTHHTLYEQYIHYFPGELGLFRRFIVELATRYANLSDAVFSPSESIRDILQQRGVTAPVHVVPTGVRLENFASGEGLGLRQRHGIPADALVVGHLGRLAPEKNLSFLAEAVAAFLRQNRQAWFLVVGSGPSEPDIRRCFEAAGIADRLVCTGVLQHRALADALAAMDLFAFASQSETQGMVLTEAMAAGLPVVALDASGVREVLRDGHNGRLLPAQESASFAAALDWVARQSDEGRAKLRRAALETAREYSLECCADQALAHYQRLCDEYQPTPDQEEFTLWEQVLGRIKAEWDIIKSVTIAGDEALTESLFSKEKEGS